MAMSLQDVKQQTGVECKCLFSLAC